MPLVRVAGVGVLVLVAAAITSVGADPKTAEPNERAKFESRLREALLKTPIDAFSGVHEDSVALAAAYNDLTEDKSCPETLRIERLLGFMEGRLRTSLPDDWSNVIAEQKLSVQDWARERFPNLYDEEGHKNQRFWGPETWSLKIQEREFELPKDCRIRREFLEQGERHVPVSAVLDLLLAEDLPQEGSETRCAVAWTDDCALLAFSGFEGASFPIFCVRRTDGEILWRTTVWAFVDKPYPIFGFVNHVAELRLSKDNVYVFGHNSVTAYVQGFSLKTGERVLRFSSEGLSKE